MYTYTRTTNRSLWGVLEENVVFVALLVGLVVWAKKGVKGNVSASR